MVTPASFSEFGTRSPPVASAACPHFLLLPTFHLAQAPPTRPPVPIQLYPCEASPELPSLPRPHPPLATTLAGPTQHSSICWPVLINQNFTHSHAMSVPAPPLPRPHPAQPYPAQIHPVTALLSAQALSPAPQGRSGA